MSDKDRLEELRGMIQRPGPPVLTFKDEERINWAVDRIEQQQKALDLAGEVLEDLDEYELCDCQIQWTDDEEHRDDCAWTKTNATLTAIKEAKDIKSHQRPDPSQDQE